MDDILGIVTCFRGGTRWINGRLQHSEEEEEKDAREGKSKQEVTLEALKEMANSLTPYLRFTGEVSLNGQPIPVLDTQIWYGDNKGGDKWFQGGRTHGKADGKGVQYTFYSKPMTNPLGILRRSALSENTKVSTAGAEVMRRIKNCSEDSDKRLVEEALISIHGQPMWNGLLPPVEDEGSQEQSDRV